MKTMKIHSFNLPDKYTHILATSNVSFSFATQQFLGVNGFYPLQVNSQEPSKLLVELSTQERTVDKNVREQKNQN